MTKALVPIAEGVEEMEAVIIIDCFRRAGWDVTVAGVPTGSPITASRQVGLVPDIAWDEIDPCSFDVLAIPGGAGGTDILSAHVGVLEAVRAFVSDDKLLGAICAAPLVLQAAGVLDGRRVTCHPGVVDSLSATERLPDPVVVDDRLVTSQGPGTCFEFSLTMIELIEGPRQRAALAQAMVLAH